MSDLRRELAELYPRARTKNHRAAFIVKVIASSDVVADAEDEKSAFLAVAREVLAWAGDEFFVKRVEEN
jgi:hypothetical protein